MKEELHRPTRRSERILQLKLEAFSPREGNVTCRKRMRYNQPSEQRSKAFMKKDRKDTSDGEKQNVNHIYRARLETKRKYEFEFYHGLGKKTKTTGFSNEENDRLKGKYVEKYYEPQFHNSCSCIGRTDIIMNESFLNMQRLDGKDSTNIGLCNEPFATVNSDLYQDQSVYPSLKDLKIEVGQYKDNDYPSRANPTTISRYIESLDTSVTSTKVTVKDPVTDDYEKGTDCTEDNENDNEDIDTPGSTRSELRIRPIERRSVLVPLRIRLLKNQTMRKAWKKNTTCCLKYCWVDWPTVTVGQI
ncbi:hypothetical protein CHS0354_014596 [Potamilus streckersoni]|uniref:Uncharacterized protein n=1 Tax=Potamilus streckersoni TaxID=2493646 RepID=A0AAE0VG43_9BIVA|nr:hypothetical protein CHS0354_014596 [Potamilus streckersoni]